MDNENARQLIQTYVRVMEYSFSGTHITVDTFHFLAK